MEWKLEIAEIEFFGKKRGRKKGVGRNGKGSEFEKNKKLYV